MSRTVYLGTSAFAERVLSALSESPHKPELVVTPPDSRRGRGRKAGPPPVAQAATQLELPLLQTPDTSDAAVLERIRSAEPDVLVVCAFGQIIREPLLSEFEILNIHPSLLPRWRGAAPIERAIMAGDEQTGVCVMRLVEELDAGPVALRDVTTIGEREDFESLDRRLAEIAGSSIVEALNALGGGGLVWADQKGEVVYAEKVTKEDRLLRSSLTADELDRTVRALHPHIGTYLQLTGDERLGVERAAPVNDAVAAGTFAERDGVLLLGCSGDTALRIDLLKPPGGRAMAPADYLRGHPLPELAEASA